MAVGMFVAGGHLPGQRAHRPPSPERERLIGRARQWLAAGRLGGMEYATTTDPKTGKPIVEFQCPSCSTGHRAALADAGSPTSCSRCKAAFRVPGVDDAAKASPSRRAEPPKQAAPPTASAPAPTAARVSDLPPTEYSELIRQAVKSGVLSALVTVVGVLILLGSIFAAVLGVSD